MQLRPYQAEAVSAVYDHLRQRDDNPCVVLPTGTGKSLILAQIAKDAVEKWSGRVLILAHVKELLEQNASKVRALCRGLDVGVYSAGLNRRDTDNPVVVAGIQSVYQRACALGAVDLAIVDESHLIPPDGEGRYRQFLAEASVVNPNLRVIGLTATPYRMKGGLICTPENILNDVCYEAGIREMIAQGYLCKLRSRSGRAKADLAGLHVHGGEFIASEVESAMDQDALVRSACQEIVDLTRDRNSVLIFTSSVPHCRHVAAEIARFSGAECGIVTGETPAGERAELLARFRGEPVAADLFGNTKPALKYLANVNVLTTGFDATNVDCVVLLRPTASVGLYVQMVGRGTRIHPGKDDCLILDYGGNVLRHGPVDAVVVEERTSGAGEAPAKECPQCMAVIHAGYAVCPECGHQFPPPEREKHEHHASTAGILTGEVTETGYEVSEVSYGVHVKRGAPEDHPRSMRVDYRTGFNDYQSEWVCPEHTGYARAKFEAWWRARSNEPFPATADVAVDLAEAGALAPTRAITVRSVAGEKFDRVTDYQIGSVPPRMDGSDERDDGLELPDWPPDDSDIPF